MIYCFIFLFYGSVGWTEPSLQIQLRAINLPQMMDVYGLSPKMELYIKVSTLNSSGEKMFFKYLPLGKFSTGDNLGSESLNIAELDLDELPAQATELHFEVVENLTHLVENYQSLH
ncbi:MAG: hypothetical protein R2827_14570 [Bdellovibrionales bacterium]